MIRSIALVIVSLALGGCWRTVDTACSAFRPITYDARGDTVETRQQVREHNAAWVALCQ